MANVYTQSLLNNCHLKKFTLFLSISLFGLVVPRQLHGQEFMPLEEATAVTVEPCSSLSIESITIQAESACGAGDGQIIIRLREDLSVSSSYTLRMHKGDKVVRSYTGLRKRGNEIVLTRMLPDVYKQFTLTRESDGCMAQSIEQEYLLRHGCSFNDRGACGTGTFNYLNCDNQNIVIDRSYLDPDTYIFADDDYLGCIAYVDNSCTVQTSVRAYCLNFELTEPTPAKGYPYGSVTFDRKVGIDNLTIETTIFGTLSTATDAEKELAAERIAYVMCQGASLGYSLSSINSAIWYFSETNTSCNGLCNLAITRVPYAVGNIKDQIIIYEPSVSTVQPYIETGCYTARDYADAPSSYGNPYHIIEDECRVHLGSFVDAETVSAYSTNADGDDNDNLDDEDGVTWTGGATLIPNGQKEITVGIMNQCHSNDYLTAWVDFNGDGDFNDSGEKIIDNYNITTNSNSIQNVTFNFEVPADASCGTTYARFRIDDSTISSPTASEIGGEVEDYLVTIDCGNPTSTPGDYTFDCGSGKEVDLYGAGAENENTTTVSIPSSGNVFQYVVEVIYKDGNPGNTTYFSDASNNVYSMTRQAVPGLLNNVYVYRGQVTGSTSSITYQDFSTEDKLQSVMVYAFRNTGATTGYTTGEFTSYSSYSSVETFNYTIPSDFTTRDITVDIPISELTTDCRILNITVSAGGVSSSFTLDGPDTGLGGCCLAIPSVTLNNVPASATTLSIEIDSPSSGSTGCPSTANHKGQSYVFAGIVNLDIECADCSAFDPGTISASEADCGSYDPAEIVGTDPYGIGSDCPANGTILLERYDGISGSSVSDLVADSDYPNNPSSTSTLTSLFEAPTNILDNYGQRLSAYLCAPTTGNYTFWIASDDGSQLWLSTDDNPSNKVQIASVSGWTNSREWTKFSSQQSATIALVAGEKYYIEALMKEGGGGDNLAVGWQLPSGTLERPIPASYFSSGAGNGDLSYQWQSRPSGGSWTNISGATGVNYDPSTISSTTQYRRRAISDKCGTFNSNVVTKTVQVAPSVTVTTTDPSCGLDNGQITFSFSDVSGRSNIEFSNDGGATYPLYVADNIGSASFTDLADGTYDIWVRWGNDECPVDLGTVTLTDQDQPAVSITDDLAICEGESTDLTATGSGGVGTLTYEWSTTETTPTITVSPVVTTTYNVTVTDDNGCEAVEDVVVTVYEEIEMDIASTNPTCGEDNGTITGTVTSNPSGLCLVYRLYNYTIDDWETGWQTSPVFTGLAPGSYRIKKWTDLDCDGSGSSLCYQQFPSGTIDLVDEPGPVITPAGDESICLGSDVTLSVVASGGTGTLTYLWNTGSTATSINVNPTVTTTYTVTVTDENDCTTVDEIVVTVNPNPTANAGGDQEICECLTFSNSVITVTASEYNAFIEGNMTVEGGESEGPIALGGNLTIDGNYNVGLNSTGNFVASGDAQPSALVIGGRVFYNSSSGVNVLNNGYTKIGNLTGSNVFSELNGSTVNTRITPGGFDTNPKISLTLSQPEASVGQSGVINFASNFAAFRSNSSSLSGLTANNTISGTGTGTINLTNSQVNVINITGAALDAYSQLTFSNTPNSSRPLVINVNTGGSFSWSLPTFAGIGDAQGAYILWNFYNTTSLSISGGQSIYGTFLAPDAAFTKNSTGNINGQVIAASYIHKSGEIHNFPFNASLGLGTCEDAGRAVTLTATGGVSFLWSTGATSSSILVNPLETTTYMVTVTDANGCTDVDDVTVTVLDAPSITFNGAGPFCIDDGSTNLSASPSGGTFSGTGITNGAAGTFDPGTAGVGAHEITYTYTNGDGCSNTAEITVVVNDLPSVSFPNLDEVCENGGSVTLSASPSGGTFSGPGVTGNSFNPATAGPGIHTLTYTYTNGEGCTNSDESIIVVNGDIDDPGTIGNDEAECGEYDPAEIIELTPADAPDCIINCCFSDGGDKPVTVTMQYTGEDCSATTTGQNSTINSCSGDPNFDNEVYIIASNKFNYSSGLIWFQGTVALNDTYVIDAANGGQSRLRGETHVLIFDTQGGTLLQSIEFHTSCSEPVGVGEQYGANRIVEISLQSGAGCDLEDSELQYQWQSREGTSGPWTDITGATNTTYDPGTISTTTQYRRVVSNCCDSEPSNIVTKTVYPVIEADAGSDEQICEGESIILTANHTGGTGDVTYLWSTGATTQAISVSPSSTTTYTVTITDENDCEDSDDVIVTVDETNLSLVGASDFFICVDGEVTFEAEVVDPINFVTVEFLRFDTQQSDPYTSGDASVSLGEFLIPPAIGSVTSSNFPQSGTTPVTYYVYALLKPAPTAGFCTPFIEYTVTVYPDPEVSASVDNAEVCIDGSSTLTGAVTGGSGSFTYQWQSATDVGGPYSDISGATNITYVVPTATAGTTYYQLVVTDVTEGCDDPVSTPVEVVVNPDLVITAEPGDDEICEGGTSILTVGVTGGAGTITYQWQISTDGTNFSDISGATNATYTTDPLTATTYYQVLVEADASGCEAATSAVATITVIDDLAITAQPQDDEICEGGTATVAVTVSGGAGTITYQWQS